MESERLLPQESVESKSLNDDDALPSRVHEKRLRRRWKWKVQIILPFCFLLVLFSYQLCLYPWSLNRTCLSSLKLSSDSGVRASGVLAFLASIFAFTSTQCDTLASASVNYGGPSSNGLTDVVQWDKYSLFVRGQRIFLWSGEFHTWRLPVPDLWRDILEKVKAAGLNGISVYIHWGLSNPAPGVLDFDEYRALQPLFDMCKETGLFVVVRPGPYINAETTAGGIAHWVTSEVASHLRTNASDYHAAWEPYITAVSKVTRKNQITEGGPVIAVQVDNEYTQSENISWPGKAEMMVQLEDTFRANGIVVPLTFNDANELNNYATGKGAVDIYGFDSYPQSFDCSRPEYWFPVVTNYYDYHVSVNPQEPLYIPEFQGGAFSAWGPNSPAYNTCLILTGPEFESVFYKNLWASNVKMANFYMIYGGTSWGHIPFPGVYTSYDYGASISENRVIGSKYTELKRQGLFLRSAPDFYKTDVIGNSTSGTVTINNDDVFVTELRNPDTGSGFYVARQTNSSSLANVDFTIKANTSQGSLQLPQSMQGISLNGRESKLILTDFQFGSSGKLLYSTASVLFAGKLAGRDVLFLYGDIGQQHEAAVRLSTKALSQPSNATVDIMFSQTVGGYTLITFLPKTEGLIFVYESSSQLVLFADSDTAGTFWAPVIPDSSSELSNYWSIGSNETILVGGPYLVRSADISGSSLNLRGDLNGSTTLTLIGTPESIRHITWNGAEVETDSTMAASGDFVTTIAPKSKHFAAPKLNGWRYADSLPEVKNGYDDSAWAAADHKTTKIPYKSYSGASVLYGCDYGFCEGAILWRGHFTANGGETAVNLSINGGEAFAASVWINDQFIATTYGNSSNNQNIIAETNTTFMFPKKSVKVGADNVITVVQDNMGLDETQDWDGDTSKSPRGIRGYGLIGSANVADITWKVQGKLGGYRNYPDKTRGVLNEGGLFGERTGWHLPAFDVSSWNSRNLSSGLPNGKAGIGFFVTEFDLEVPEGYDIPVSFTFDATPQPYRAILFINGWMMGKRVANLGPQYKYPVHEGILNYHGKNTIAVALWAMENIAVSPTLELTIDGIFEGGVGKIAISNPRWSDRGSI